MNCPICNNQGVPCSSIFRDEVPSFLQHASGDTLVETVSTSFNGKIIHEKNIIKPAKPRRPARVDFTILIFFAVTCITFAINRSAPITSLRFIIPFCFFIYAGGLLIDMLFGFKTRMRFYYLDLAFWDKNMAIWNDLSYCAQDNIVFNVLGKYFKPSEMTSFYTGRLKRSDLRDPIM